MTRRIWIDTDLGFDDMAAIMMIADVAAHEIVGMSLVAGNAALPRVIDNAARMAAFLSWHMPIHVGHGEPVAGGAMISIEGLTGTADALPSRGLSLPPAAPLPASDDAVTALDKMLAAPGPPIEVLALGPLTNLARLLDKHSVSAKRIGRLIWMGGSAAGGNHTAAAEFNAAADPEAVARVLGAGLNLKIVGLDCCQQATATIADAAGLRAAGGPRAAVLADLYEGYCRLRRGGSEPMPLYDPVAAAVLLDSQAVRFSPARVEVDCAFGPTRGMTVCEFRAHRAQPNAEVARLANAAMIRRRMHDAFRKAAR
jgi:purine nucleosidase